MPSSSKTYRCPDCRGSGQCEQCYGSGTNLHLNERDPTCRTCLGLRHCQTCAGIGSLPKPSDFREWPIGLRLIASAIPAFILYEVVIARKPVHFGRGGPIMPKAAGLLTAIAFCVPFLFVLWKDVKLRDLNLLFKSRKDRPLSILDQSPDPPASSGCSR